MEADASLMEVLEGIYDPRNARGKRHPLPALLALAVVAMLAGMISYEAIVDYGKERGGEFLRLLGFTRRRGLCKATYSRVFRRIDVADFESRVGRWIRGQLGPREASHLAIDGKTARGSRDGETPGIHLVSAYAPDVKAVVGQLRVDAKTNEHKAALELLGVLSVKGRVISGDAMFTHRDVCAKVIEGGGDYIFPVRKTNRHSVPTSRPPSLSLMLGFPPSRQRGPRPRSTELVRLTKGTVGSRSERSRSHHHWLGTLDRTGRAVSRSSA